MPRTRATVGDKLARYVGKLVEAWQRVTAPRPEPVPVRVTVRSEMGTRERLG